MPEPMPQWMQDMLGQNNTQRQRPELRDFKNRGLLGIGKDLANLTIRGRLAKNLYPVGYHDSDIRLFESVLLNKKDSKRSLMDDLANGLYGSHPLAGTSQRRLDALNMLMGFKQKYNSFEESKYRPSIGDNKNLKYCIKSG